MRGWVNIMVRVVAVCLLLIAGVQAGAACAAPNPAPGHSMSHAPTAPVQNKHMVGMVNFRTPGGRGGAAHSQYLTFRVMAEDSKGWIAKAVPGRWPARTTVELMRPLAERAFKEACEEDVRIILRGTAK